MSTSYKILPDPVHSDRLTVHPLTAAMLGIANREKTTSTLQFGRRSCPIAYELSADVGEDEIVISQNVIRSLAISSFCRYEIASRKDRILIGPFIGILMNENMTPKPDNSPVYPHTMRYVQHYEQIGGAVVVFSIEGINTAKRLIAGYMYNPQEQSWSRGVFPYPASLLKLVRLSDELAHHLKKHIGENRIFNIPNLNKWNMHQLLSTIPEIREHLPESILYESSAELVHFVDNHKQLYVKPIYGSDGKGVIKISKQGEGILAQYRKDAANQQSYFATADEFRHSMIEEKNKEEYMLQKALQLISVGGQIIDFRLNLVKNQSGKWQDIGMFARYGQIHSIVSNTSEGGKAKDAEKTLRSFLRLSKPEADAYRRRMHLIGMKIVRSLDENGLHCGNVGLDLAVDTEGKLWIIEVNTVDPGFGMFESAGKLSNMLYAKRLAGFHDK